MYSSTPREIKNSKNVIARHALRRSAPLVRTAPLLLSAAAALSFTGGRAARPAPHSGALMLYVRLRKVFGTGTTQMFNPRLSFEIRAD